MIRKVRQVVAWITILIIVVLIIGMVICAVTGSSYFFGMLFLAIAVPVVLWVFMWFTQLINDDKRGTEPEDRLR